MINPIHEQFNWSTHSVATGYWFTLLLLCTSAPLVLYCDRFDRGSRQVKREPVDLLMEDYDVSLSQRVETHNYYTKDHIITCDRCTSGKFYSFVRWIIWWQITSDEDAWRPLIRFGITCIYVFYGFVVIFYLAECHGIYEIDYIISFFGGSCISKNKENAQRILSNCNLYVTRLMLLLVLLTTNKRWKTGKHVLFSRHYKPCKLSSME